VLSGKFSKFFRILEDNKQLSNQLEQTKSLQLLNAQAHSEALAKIGDLTQLVESKDS
jgi:hypothetical protein